MSIITVLILCGISYAIGYFHLLISAWVVKMIAQHKSNTPPPPPIVNVK